MSDQIQDVLMEVAEAAKPQAPQENVTEVLSEIAEVTAPKDEAADVPIDEKAETPAEEPIVAEPVVDEEEAIIVDDEPIEAPALDIDLSWAKDVIGKDVKGVEDIKAYVDSVKQERDIFKAQAETKFANEKVKAINDYVSSGGDIDKYVGAEQEIADLEGYLESVKTFSPQEAYKAYLINRLGNAEEAEDALASMTDTDIKLRGLEVLDGEAKNTKSTIEAKRKSIESLVNEQKQKTERSKDMVAEAIKKVEVINGVKLPKSELNNLMKFNSTADIIRELFPLDNEGLPIAEAWARTYAQVKLGERAAKVLKQKVSTDTRKQEFKELHNVQQPLQQHVEKPRDNKHLTADQVDELAALIG